MGPWKKLIEIMEANVIKAAEFNNSRLTHFGWHLWHEGLSILRIEEEMEMKAKAETADKHRRIVMLR